jgi:hypothetical protein
VSIVIDPDDLARAVAAPVASYAVEAIGPHLRLHSVTGGVYRVHGTTTAGDVFSLVVKVVRHGVDDDPDGLWVAGEQTTHRNYWKREWLAFDTGLLDAMPGRLRAPRTLLTTQAADDECWIWMEDVRGRSGAALTAGDYATVAHDLGTTQGAFASGAAVLPDNGWLSRDWLRGWVDACTPFAEAVADDAMWHDGRLASMSPLRDRIVRLWAGRDALFGIVASAPPTLVHCDFWPTNIICADDGTTVAIDWSQVGIGSIAQDLDQITLDTVWMQVRPDASLDTLERTVLPAYRSGLHDGGLDVDTVQLHRWYAGAAALHYPWMCGLQAVRARLPGDVEEQEARFGRTFAALVADRARVIERAVALGESALGSVG